MPSLGTFQSPWTRLQRLVNAQQEGLRALTDVTAQAVDLEARRRVSERPMPVPGDPSFEPGGRVLPEEAAPYLRQMGPRWRQWERGIFPVPGEPSFEPRAALPSAEMTPLERTIQRRWEGGVGEEVAAREITPPGVPFALGRPLEYVGRRFFDPIAAAGLQLAESPAGAGLPGVPELKAVTRGAEQLGIPESYMPTPRTRTFGEAYAGGPVNVFAAAWGSEEEQEKAQAVLEEAGLPRAMAARVVFDLTWALPGAGVTKIDDVVRLVRLGGKAGGAARARVLSNPTLRRFVEAVKSEAGGPRGIPRPRPGEPVPVRPDPHVARADPSPPPPEGPPPKRPRAPSPDDPEFDDIQRLVLEGEKPDEALIRRHQGAIDTAKRDAAIEVREANQMLKDAGLGRTFRGSVVAKEEGAFSELNRLLHNPSKVESGEMVVSDELRPVYDRLRAGTDWEQAARVDFDPDMALIEDYFFRGWQPPEGMFTGEARGALGRSPAFRLPRVNATYDEMIEAGFKPLFENSAEQMRYSRMMGVRYREQMKLIEQIKAKELALPDLGGAVPDGWRVPRVGPAFEGKPYASGNQVAFTRRWAVPDSLANRLENVYGKTPSLGKGEIFGRTIDFQAAVDAAVFMPKRAKLIGSLFQHVDFLGRSHVGAWTGFIDALRRGQPVDAVYHLLKWPESAADIVRATFSPGFRGKLAKLAVDDTPLFEGRKLSNRMISEAGLSLRDETILPELDQVIRQVATEGRAQRWAKAPLRLLGDLERTWRKGLFEGVYPAAILTDVKNNIAPAIVRQHPRATDEQLAGMIAKAANTSYSTIPAATSVVQNQQARWFLTRFLFSMAENEGLLRAFTGAIRGADAAYFRTRLLGTYLGVMTLANTIHFASTGEPLPFSRYTPISKDKWGPLPFGYNTEFASPTIPLTGRGGAEITLDLMGQMDTAFRVLDPISFLNARVSVPARAGLSQATGKDFFGAPIDTVGPGGISSRTAQLIQDLFAPIGPGQAGLEALRSNVEETEGLIQPGEDRLGAAGIGVQATGVNIRAETTPQLLDRIRAEVMQEKGIEGRYEDIKATDSPLANEIDDEVEARIGPELEMRRETSKLRGQTTPESQFYEEQEISRGRQEEEQLADDANLNSGQWSGDVWRERLRDRQRDFFNQREGLKQAFKIEFEEKHAPSGSVNAALDAYFDVDIDDHPDPRNPGETDWDGFFEAQEKALAPLSPKDKARVMEFLRKYDTPTIKEFRKAEEVVDRFYSTPKYKGLSLERGEEVDRVLYDLAPALQTRFEAETGEKLSRRDAVRHLAAIIRDKKAREFLLEHFGGGVQAGLRRIGEGAGLRRITDVRRETDEIRNEKRDQILVDNERLLARFYNDLLERELSREQEAGLLPTTLEALFGPGMALPDIERRGLQRITAAR